MIKIFTNLSAIVTLILFSPFIVFSQWTVEMEGTEGTSIEIPVGKSTFGDLSKTTLEGEVVFVKDHNAETSYACGRLAGNVAGKIAVVQRGGDCDFLDKVINLQENGAMAVIICNDNYGTHTMGSSRADASEVEIRSVMMGKSHCLHLSQNVDAGKSGIVINTQRADDVLWSDDFSDESTWVFTDDSPEPYGWVITDDPEDIPNAAPSLFPFASSTAENGFAMIDSDGSPWMGDGAGRIRAEITTATPIDLSGEENVLLRFQHNYRWWQDTRGVRISGDNGDTWTTYEITNLDGYPNEQNTDNPEIETIDISDAAGNASEVLVQFYYDDNNFWGWYWAVDDAEILRLPNNDLAMDDAFYPPLSYATPAAHLPVDSFGFSCNVRNAGALDRSDVEVSVSIINTANDEVEYHDVVVLNNFLRGADSLVIFDDLYRPELDPGLYIIRYNVEVPGEPDFSPEDNELNYTFVVTEDLFAKNDPALNNFTGGITNDDDNWYWGNMYYISPEAEGPDRTLLSVDLAFVPSEGSFTDESAILYILEYGPAGPIIDFGNLNANSELPPNLHPEFNPKAAYIITTNELINAGAGQVFSIYGDELLDPATFQPLGEQIVMNPGKLYGAIIQFEEDGLEVPFSRDVDYGTGVGILYVDNSEGQKQYFSGYTNISAPVVRMRTGIINSADDIIGKELKPLNVFPNPTSEDVNIEFEMDRPDQFKMDIIDMQGKSVISRSIEGNNKNSLHENLGSFQSGKYIIRIISEDGVRSAPLIIVR